MTFSPVPPIAPIHPTRIEIHNDVLVDNYGWLRERDNPAVIAYLEAENAYTAAIMTPTTNLQETLYTEMRDRIQQTDLSVPDQIDDVRLHSPSEAVGLAGAKTAESAVDVPHLMQSLVPTAVLPELGP